MKNKKTNEKVEVSTVESKNVIETQKTDIKESKTIKKEPKKIKDKKTNGKSIGLWIAMSVAILFWLASFLRVPYVGTFLDSVFFEFTVGFAKYPLYALLMVYILSIKIPKLREIFCQKKRPLWFFAPIFILVVILNTIDSYKRGYNVTIAKELYLGNDGYITNWLTSYWEKTVINFEPNFGLNWLPKGYAWGGIIGLVVVFTVTYFSSAVLIIVLVILFIIFGLILFSKKYKDKKVKDMMNDFWKKDSPSKTSPKDNKEEPKNSSTAKA